MKNTVLPFSPKKGHQMVITSAVEYCAKPWEKFDPCDLMELDQGKFKGGSTGMSITRDLMNKKDLQLSVIRKADNQNLAVFGELSMAHYTASEELDRTSDIRLDTFSDTIQKNNGRLWASLDKAAEAKLIEDSMKPGKIDFNKLKKVLPALKNVKGPSDILDIDDLSKEEANAVSFALSKEMTINMLIHKGLHASMEAMDNPNKREVVQTMMAVD